MKAMFRCLGYLIQHPTFKLGGRLADVDILQIFSDSDFGGDKGLTKQSQSGILIILNGWPLYWQSKKQIDTTYSSTAAEIYALSETIRGAFQIRNKADELLLSDNM